MSSTSPALPAESTTVVPSAVSSATCADSGSSAGEPSAPRERLSTSMRSSNAPSPFGSAAQSSASDERFVEPATSPKTLRE